MRNSKKIQVGLLQRRKTLILKFLGKMSNAKVVDLKSRRQEAELEEQKSILKRAHEHCILTPENFFSNDGALIIRGSFVEFLAKIDSRFVKAAPSIIRLNNQFLLLSLTLPHFFLSMLFYEPIEELLVSNQWQL